MLKKRLATVLVVFSMSVPMVVLADNGQTPHRIIPLDNAIDRLQDKANTKPDNKGLQNALERVKTNKRRFIEKHVDVRVQPVAVPQNDVTDLAGPDAPGNRSARSHVSPNELGQSIERAASVERPVSFDRAEKIERPNRPERVERVERVERPNRPERVQRVDRIDRPGRGLGR